MRKLTTLLLSVLFLTAGQAQNKDKPWAIGAGLHWVDFHGLAEGGAKATQEMKLQGGLGEISFGRYLSPVANLQLTVGTLTFKPEEYDLAGMGVITKDNLLVFDLDYQYKFLGNSLPATCKVVPYIYGGIGGQSFNDDFQFKVQWGAGFDFWAFKDLGIYLRADYSYPLDMKIVNYWHPHAGIKFRFGCSKDRDKDGIADKADRCPDVFGIAAFQGCPDTDGDGIADIDDKCPDVKGISALHGCPDKDGDGITDAEDRCPDVAGTKALKGCPDKDGDGIADIDDKCPDVKGLEKFNGCPDTDGDGIVDSMDECPKEAGLEKFKGCPDSDNDGVPDKDDKCPKVAGTIANKGCPEITQEEQQKIINIAKAVYFDTGKDVLKPESKKKLDELIPILAKYPEMNLIVEGHTDDVGDDTKNQKLSQDRVNSVKQYLSSKGIAVARITAVGYGEQRPIAPNKTADGRAKNRRVEIKTAF